MANPDPRDITILPRPQISVYLGGNGEVTISVTGVSDDCERIEMHDVSIPLECAEEVARALLEFAGKK